MTKTFENTLKSINERRRLAAEAEQEYRRQRLNPKDIAYWTKAVTTIGSIISKMPPPKKTCSYQNWLGLLNEYSREPPFTGAPPKWPTDLASRLMSFAEDVAKPTWPEQREDLIEFSFSFLEADVMLFRSGYMKAHLIKRLKQADLQPHHIARCEVLIRNSILIGSGLEEAKAYRNLAGHLIVQGLLPDLTGWLETTARGTLLTRSRSASRLAPQDINLDQQDMKKWVGNPFKPPKWAVTYPEMSSLLPARENLEHPSQKVKYSAYLMLNAVNLRKASKTTGGLGCA